MIAPFRTVALVLGLLTCSVALGEGSSLDQKRFAVLEFRSDGAPPRSLGMLSDEVRGTLAGAVKARGALVLTRDNMLEVTRATGGECKEGQCELETARNLNVHWFVVGDLAQVEGRWVLSIKFYETRQGSLLGARRLMAGTELELLDQVAPASLELLRTLPEFSGQDAGPAAVGPWRESQSLAPAGARAVVRFESLPPKAVVRLDGALLCSQTPCNKAVALGRHEVTVEAERHVPRKEVLVFGPDTRTVRMQLEPTFGWLTVDAGGADVPIRVGGELVGRRRVTALERDPGAYVVSLEDPCWLSVRESAVVKAGTVTQHKLQAERRAVLVDFSAMDTAQNELAGQLEVDGAPVGRFPGQYRIPVCSDDARFVLDDGRSARQPLELKPAGPGESLAVRIDVPSRSVPATAVARVDEPVRKHASVSTAWWVAAAGGGAALAFGGATLGVRSHLSSLPAGDGSVGPWIATGTTTQVLAVGGLVTAVAATVVALAAR